MAWPAVLKAIGYVGAAAGSAAAGLQSTKEMAKSIERGAKSQANVERGAREFTEKEFEKEQARREPFVLAGKEALPMLVNAISNKLESTSPLETTQKDMISSFLGDNAPRFVVEKVFGNLSAIESEKQKGRLSDLVNIGAGGVASQAGSGVGLSTSLASSLTRSGSATAEALQSAAEQRQTGQNRLAESVAGLPAYYVAARGPRADTQQPINQINPNDFRARSVGFGEQGAYPIY